MGTLHDIFQLRPNTIHGAAFIKINETSETVFQDKYRSYINKNFNPVFPHNTILEKISSDYVLSGFYQEERLII